MFPHDSPHAGKTTYLPAVLRRQTTTNRQLAKQSANPAPISAPPATPGAFVTPAALDNSPPTKGLKGENCSASLPALRFPQLVNTMLTRYIPATCEFEYILGGIAASSDFPENCGNRQVVEWVEIGAALELYVTYRQRVIIQGTVPSQMFVRVYETYTVMSMRGASSGRNSLSFRILRFYQSNWR